MTENFPARPIFTCDCGRKHMDPTSLANCKHGVVTGTCAGSRAGHDPCLRPCGDTLMGCTVDD